MAVVTPRKRNRAFYIFDRSIPVAYEQGKDHNVVMQSSCGGLSNEPTSFKIECHATRYGMTLVEMLVATTMTLVIMGVVVQLFGMVGNGVSASRASLGMSSELRTVAHALRNDLNGITVETVPPVKVDSDSVS